MTIRQAFRRKAGKQRGIVLVLIVVGITSVLGIAGLALDFGLAFLTKSRIQNALDAAALSGAKVLKATGDTAQARADAQAAFNYYLGQLNRLDEGLTPTFEFSETVAPEFADGSGTNFIRVKMPAGYTIPTYLTRVFPGVGDTLTLSGSAVAGPIRLAPPNELCNIVPIMVSVNQPLGEAVDTDCTDDGQCFGYRIGEQLQLTLTDSAGPGNFNLLRLGEIDLGSDPAPAPAPSPGKGAGKNGDTGGNGNNGGGNGNTAGGNVLRDNLAGAFGGCRQLGGDESELAGTNVNTQPGRLTGPFKQGLNTRFGEHGPAGLSEAEYPPDINTDVFATYEDYKSAVAAGTLTDPPPIGVPGRRIVRIVFSDVRDGGFNGATEVPISGFGCFFLLSPAEGQGNGVEPLHIDAEFTNDCAVPAGGPTNLELDNEGAFFKIVLYKDPDSRES